MYGVFFPGRTWVIICTRSSWTKNTPHIGVDPGKINERTHYLLDVGDMDSAHNKGLQVKDKDRYWFYSFTEPVISLDNIIALDKRAVT